MGDALSQLLTKSVRMETLTDPKGVTAYQLLRS